MKRSRCPAAFAVLVALAGAALAILPRPVAASDGGARSPTSDPRCGVFAEENAKTYTLLAGCKDCTEALRGFFDGAGACHADAHGAWGLVIDSARMRTRSQASQAPALASLAVGWRLVRRDDPDAGGPIEGSVVPFVDSKEDMGSVGENWALILDSWNSIVVESPTYIDYDGDGVDEVILSAGRHGEGYSPPAHEICWSFPDRALPGRVSC